MIIKGLTSDTGTEVVKATLVALAGVSTLIIPEGSVISKVWYDPAVAGDDGGFDITIDGSGTDIVIGSASAADASQDTEGVVWMDGWFVGSGQAGILKAAATGSPTVGSGVLYAQFTRSVQV